MLQTIRVMLMNDKRSFAVIGCFVLAVAASLPAAALTLSYSTTWDGASNLTLGPGTITTEFDPVHDGFSHSFADPTPCCVMNGSSSTGYGFVDDYVFDVPAGTFTATISTDDSSSSGITGIAAGLFSVDAGGATNALPALGKPNGTFLEAVTRGSDNGSVLMVFNTVLQPGVYALQITGDVTGRLGGLYSGSIQFASAVTPIPSALPLLLSGLGMLVILGRRTLDGGREKQ
jgi:hypothetical protein